MGNMAGRWEGAKIIMRDFEPLINAGKFKEAELLIDRALVLIGDRTTEDLGIPVQAPIHGLAKSDSGILPLIGVAVNAHKNSSSDFKGAAESMDLLTESGMNIFGLAPTWQKLERTPGEFNLQDELINPLSILVPLYHQLNGVVVTLKMIDTGWRPMPEDIKDKPFDSPEVLRRFDALIDAIAKEPSTKRITHILLGNEIFGYLLLHPEEIPAFITFYRQGVNRIHQKMPWVKVGTIIGFEGMERLPDAFKKLLDSSDFMAYTYYPQSNIEMVGWQMRPISEVAGHLHFMAEHAGSKPFAFTEIGYSSSPINGSSEEKQAEFVKEMFRVLDPYWKKGQIAFLLYHLMYDYPPSFTDPYAKEQGIEPSKEFRAFVENLGLRSYETGKPRKGWDTFVQGVENWIPKTSFVEDMEGEEIQSPSKSLKEKKQRLELLAERWHSVEKVMQDFQHLLEAGKYREAESVIDEALASLKK